MPLGPPDAHVGDVGLALRLLLLVGGLANGGSCYGTAHHANYRAHVAAVRPSCYSADGRAEDAAKGAAHVGARARVSVATAKKQQCRHADNE